MGKLEIVQHLYEYNEYANSRLLEVAAQLSESEQTRQLGAGASFGSLLATLAHIAGAQEVWLSRWVSGRNARPLLEAQALESLDDVRAAMEESHAGLRDLVAELTEDRLDEDLAYTPSSGGHQRRPLWQLMVHVANHGTYHRGEAAMALTALGHSPGDLDFSFWVRDRDAD
jgi:uncharacterized damage-inducible protein DinB